MMKVVGNDYRNEGKSSWFALNLEHVAFGFPSIGHFFKCLIKGCIHRPCSQYIQSRSLKVSNLLHESVLFYDETGFG